MANEQTGLYGMTAQFTDSKSLIEAVEKARAAGYKKINAYTPYFVEELDEALGNKGSIAPYIVLTALIVGALIGFLLQYVTSVEVYALNVGGRPLNSWPAFIPITFELGVLFAGFMAVGLLFMQTGFPVPYHSIFNAPKFELASSSHFFLLVESADRKFDEKQTREFLQSLGPVEVGEVTW